MNNNFLPAGISLDSNFGEFFSSGTNEVQLIAKGKIYHNYDEVPDEYRHIVRAHMLAHPEAIVALRRAGVADRTEREKRYVWCMCAGFSAAPDIDIDTQTLNPEINTICEACQYGEPFCRKNTGVLTNTETRVATLIGTGFSDKEIAVKLIKAVATITTHRQSIQRKLRELFGRPVNSALIANYINMEGLTQWNLPNNN